MILRRRYPGSHRSREWVWSIFGYTLAELRLKSEDDYNRSSFYFRFLNFAIWDMMTPEIGIDFDFGVDGSRLALKLPYFMMALTLMPCLDPHHRTWRTKDPPRRDT